MGKLEFCLLLLVLVHIVGTVYLDHAGATFYSELQLEAIFKDLNTNVYGNPRILFIKYVLLAVKFVNFLETCKIFICICICLLVIALLELNESFCFIISNYISLIQI